uniref:Uncharacterized protein n=1 Tax=Picocystis salinarum TaxID=88271 RepID=A0A7S3UI44_9CHLO
MPTWMERGCSEANGRWMVDEGGSGPLRHVTTCISFQDGRNIGMPCKRNGKLTHTFGLHVPPSMHESWHRLPSIGVRVLSTCEHHVAGARIDLDEQIQLKISRHLAKDEKAG